MLPRRVGTIVKILLTCVVLIVAAVAGLAGTTYLATGQWSRSVTPALADCSNDCR